MSRRSETSARSRGRRTPETETRNIDPRDVATIPEGWTRDQFIKDLKKATRPHQHD